MIALGLTLPHSELEQLNKKKRMMDEAARINRETEQHKRSSSKQSVKLRKEYDS